MNGMKYEYIKLFLTAMTIYAMMHERNQGLWSIPASQLHCDNNYNTCEPGSKTQNSKENEKEF